MSESFSQYATLPNLGWVGLVLVISTGWILLQRWWNQPARKRRRQAWELFYELCHAHRLDKQAISTLFALVRGHQLEHPATIFLRPDLFQSERQPARLQRRLEIIKQLRRQLFMGNPLD
jgi:hypothetical protein